MRSDAIEEGFVDAKFLASNRLGISGMTLLWVLGVGLSTIAIGLDVALGNPFTLGHSISIPLLTAALGSGLLGFWAVPLLRALKTGQFIREEGPQAHFKKKQGLPPWEASFFIPVALVVALVGTPLQP